MAPFTVDTHLFRELGALLVGRDSTALVELIKNAYDADATEVIVYAEALDDLDRAVIQVTDDGVGMTQLEFANGFLRVASRLKNTADRRSIRHHRRYTGAKGIGRLAAHKLARLLEVESVPWPGDRPGTDRSLKARIDWDRVEEAETFDQISEDAVVVESEPVPVDARPGTTIRLGRLRRRWSEAERSRFLAEVQSFEAPALLTRKLPASVVADTLLFAEASVKDVNTESDSFSVRLEGQFAAGEELWQAVAEAASWVVEISADPTAGVQYVVAPTEATLIGNPEARRLEYCDELPDLESVPFFQARILVREGSRGEHSRAWMNRAAGIRVFMEGFRVLPYGEPGNDWLSVDADYTRRRRRLQFLEDDREAGFESDEGLSALPNVGYFGAVFLMEANAPSLRMLVNREGFVPEAGWDYLVEMVRRGINLATRARAASRATDASRVARLVRPEDPISTPREALLQALERVRQHADAAIESADSGDIERIKQALDSVRTGLSEVELRSAEYISEVAITRVLASLGTQMSAFVHEMNALVSMASALSVAFEGRLERLDVSKQDRSELARIGSALVDLKRSLEREASYLVDVVTVDARRRRSRQRLHEVFETTVALVRVSAERRNVEILNEIPKELRSPPMFRAEAVSVLSNLLTNAVKAAGESGRVRSRGDVNERGEVVLTIENSGMALDLASSERWFQPFESTSVSLDPALGFGMGMGLPITRRILEEYGANVAFVNPAGGYTTAIEVRFPAR